jgi:uncharacterized protein with NRDE domain
MCLIALAWRCHPRFDLALAANRDEFHARPSLPARPWPEDPAIVGGRDLEKGGSWLLASAHGRWAAVTNVRRGLPAETAALSRGELVASFVATDQSIAAFLDALAPRAQDYGRFNLLVGTHENAHYASNFPVFQQRRLAPGVHAIANADLDTLWPKTRRLQGALADWLHTEAGSARPDRVPLLDALADTRRAADNELPDTGIGIDMERFLSPPFIVGERYGTRASTLLLAGGGEARLVERRYGAAGIRQGEDEWRFAWP